MKYEKLPKVFKTKWIKALLSGKYIQGTNGYLKEVTDEGHRYCCLGVACHIAGTTGLKNKNLIKNEGRYHTLKSINKVPSILHGDTHENKLVSKLVNMNDYGSSFKTIAEWIDKNL